MRRLDDYFEVMYALPTQGPRFYNDDTDSRCNAIGFLIKRRHRRNPGGGLPLLAAT